MLSLELGQGRRRQYRGGERIERVARTVGGPYHRPAHQRDAADHTRQGEIGQQPGLDQGRLAGAAGAENEDEGRTAIDLADQQLTQFVARAGAAEKYRRMLVFVGQERAERRVVPADHPFGHRAAGPARQQRMEMLIKRLLEFTGVGKAVRGGGQALVAGAAKPTGNERLDKIELGGALEQCFARTAALRLGHLAVQKEVRHARLARTGERVFEFPLRAGHGRTPRHRAAVFVRGQDHAETRPQNHDNDVAAMRRRDVFGILEMMRRDQRLALPQQRLDMEVIGEFAVEPRHDLLGLEPLRTDVRGRGDEDANGGLVGHFLMFSISPAALLFSASWPTFSILVSAARPPRPPPKVSAASRRMANRGSRANGGCAVAPILHWCCRVPRRFRRWSPPPI